MGIPEQEFKTRVELIDGYQFRVSFTGEGIPDLLMDEPSPVGKGEYPNSGLVLAAAIGNCMAASLTFCLRRARANVNSMRAEVFTRLERNERGRLRIKSVRVALYPELDDPSKIDRCKDIFEDFCIVSQSVREGIPVEME
ncbi:MAG TPA: OsmC family protein, partial [Methanomassiliicoccales archaeon]|nr:OsmC family protein [Methanomassiliicoccales archaeon]